MLNYATQRIPRLLRKFCFCNFSGLEEQRSPQHSLDFFYMDNRRIRILVGNLLNFLTSINLLLMIVKIKRNTRSYSVMPSVTSEGTHPCKTCDGRHLHVFIYNRILISVQSSEWRLSKPTGLLYSILINPSFKTNLSFCKIYQHQNLQLILQDFPSKIYNYIVYNYICVYNSLQFTRYLTHTSIILKHY